MEPAMRFELMTSSLPRRRSTPELRGRFIAQAVSLRVQSHGDKLDCLSVPNYSGAGDEIRTRDPQLGRLMLYQLSYTRPKSLPIVNFQLPIRSHQSKSPIGNGQSKIGNHFGAGGRI